MSAVWEGPRRRPRTLVGATVLQIVPALREELDARAAIETARTLQQAGARAIVAGASGPLLDAVKSVGAEWLPLAEAVINPVKLHRNVQALAQFATAERVDILHAFGAGAAWSAPSTRPFWRAAADKDAATILIASAPRGIG